MKLNRIVYLLILIVSISISACQKKTSNKVWSKEKAKEWYQQQKWITGANFVPSTAINELEMWQQQTFDTTTIDRELAFAESIGFNTMRVFLHNLCWEQDSTAYLKRMEEYLSISEKHKIKTMFVFFDNCWNPVCANGKQPEPFPFRHNSGWVQCPDVKTLKDTNTYSKLCSYVKSILVHFKNDKRIIIWDMYNEPGNCNLGNFPATELPEKEKYNYTLILLKKIFKTARDVSPSQPLTSGVWKDDWAVPEKINTMVKFMLDNSDIITFHNYGNLKAFKQSYESLRKYDRPIICSEYMARTNGSNFLDILPFAKENKIGAINWGLVSGKSQTIYPWESWKKHFSEEPAVWFHDVFRADGTPFDKNETDLIRKLNAEK